MRGYAAIGLDNPKTPANVGSAIRAAQVYGAAMIALRGPRFKRWPTDTMAGWKHFPLLECDNLYDVIPFSCIPVAIELLEVAEPLPEYRHPERAFYIFGAEDATLGERVLSWCKDRVFVPTKGCMNLAATVNVVLYDRMVKCRIKEREK